MANPATCAHIWNEYEADWRCIYCQTKRPAGPARPRQTERPTKSTPARSCAYCNLTRETGCRCKFRARRKRADGLNSGLSVSCENTSRETTLAEFIASISQTFPISSQQPELARGCWRWSFDLAEPVEKKAGK